MIDKHPPNSQGRKDNAAEPPGKTPGLKSDEDQEKTGEESRKSAGPNGPDAAEVGDTFKS